MNERIQHAVIGAIFGAIIGAVCWFLYGLGFSNRGRGHGINPEIADWLIWSAGLFAVLGFLFKDRVGAWIGETFSGIYDYETGRDPPLPVVLKWTLVITVVGIVLWYLLV